MTQADKNKAARIAQLWKDVAKGGVAFMKNDLGKWRYTYMGPSLDDHLPGWKAGNSIHDIDLCVNVDNANGFASLWQQLADEGGKLQFLRIDYDQQYWIDAKRGDAPGSGDVPWHWRVVAEAPLSCWLNLRTMQFTTKFSEAVEWQQSLKDPVQMYDQSVMKDLHEA